MVTKKILTLNDTFRYKGVKYYVSYIGKRVIKAREYLGFRHLITYGAFPKPDATTFRRKVLEEKYIFRLKGKSRKKTTTKRKVVKRKAKSKRKK